MVDLVSLHAIPPKEKYYRKYTTPAASLQEIQVCDLIAALRTVRRYGKMALTCIPCNVRCKPEEPFGAE
jgi:hypothetical protein